jgi:hypothetical protein
MINLGNSLIIIDLQAYDHYLELDLFAELGPLAEALNVDYPPLSVP